VQRAEAEVKEEGFREQTSYLLLETYFVYIFYYQIARVILLMISLKPNSSRTPLKSRSTPKKKKGISLTS
jgi:hypothetical protein